MFKQATVLKKKSGLSFLLSEIIVLNPSHLLNHDKICIPDVKKTIFVNTLGPSCGYRCHMTFGHCMFMLLWTELPNKFFVL